MIPQSKAKMFPAIERGSEQSAGHRSYYTFNFGKYQHQHKTPFGDLIALNEDVLAPHHSLSFRADTSFYLVLIPVVGAIVFEDNRGSKTELVAGYLQVFSVEAGASIHLSNPFDDEAVQFVQVRVKNTSFHQLYYSVPIAVCLDENINSLPVMISLPEFKIGLGKFGGRKEGYYKVSEEKNAIFTYLIDGHMEVQYRLLQSGDGMGLWEQNKIEFEALSYTAILLVIEIAI